MPQKGDTQITNFVKGYITEASPLNFPEGASLDEVNMKLKRNGSRERRLGLDYEDNYALQDTGQTAAQLAASRQRAFVWPTPSGFTDVEIGVIQIGTKLYFIDLFTANPSDNVLNSGNAFDASTASSVIDNTAVFDFALINNNLIVVSAGLDTPFILYYDGDTDTISWDTARIEIRDLYGVTDGLEDNERPTALTDAHEYNLRNQGWNTNIVTKNGAEVLAETFNGLGKYPSNSDTWSLGKIADVTDADVDKYDAETLERNSFDLGRAPRGHYIIDLYNRGSSRETLTGLTMPTPDREVRRISTVASMGGRLFYSGINSKVQGRDVSPKLSGAVLFSQIASSDADLVKCYQEADPTSPQDSDVVDTDGGVIFITEASNIIKIQNTQGSILVFANNGVWEIRGDEGGFRATSFQVNKVSNIGVIARESILDANGTIYFWGVDGIYTMTPNQLGTGYDTVNITLNTIQSAFNTLPDFTKRGVKAYYDQAENSIRWLFNLESDNVIDIPAPEPPTVTFSESTPVSDTGSEPKVAKLDSNTAIVIYKKGASTDIFYRILSIDSDLVVTASSESTFKAASPNLISGFAIEYLQDNKVIIAHTENTNTTYCTIGNWDGSTMSFGSNTSVSTDFRPVLVTNQLTLGRVDSSKVILGGRYVTNFRPSAMVISIDASDNITNGTIAFTTSSNSISSPDITILTSGRGVMSWNGPISTTQMEVFTVSSATITWDGTNYSFPNATQFPSASSRSVLNVDIAATSSASLVAIGEGTIVESGVSTHTPIIFQVTEGSGVLTSTTAFQDTDHDNGAASTTRYHTINTDNGDNICVACSASLSPNELWVTKYNSGATAQEYDLDVNTYSGSDNGRNPDITHLGNGRYILTVWDSTSGATINSYGIRAT